MLELLRQELNDARGRTDELFRLVKPDSLYDRPIPERHRIIFYLGHLEAFDWNLVRESVGLESFHPSFDRLFAFGIDPRAGNLPDDQPSEWPATEEIVQYNARIRSEFDAALHRTPEQLLHVAIEHRLMHAETFAYILHNLDFDRKITPPLAVTPSGPRPDSPMAEVSSGPVTMGRARTKGFGWDNEFEAHSVEVGAYAISKYKVTNGDYLEFVKQGARPPHFWTLRRGEWIYRGMFQDIPLPLDWPVYVTHEEASAYARWKAKSLPTEAQFHRAAYDKPLISSGNFDFRNWDPVPVRMNGENGQSISQMVGNGWEWTSTAFHPFPGFDPFPFYPGYSASFFDGEHYVLKGASPRTAARLLRPSFRNWFRPSYPYVYATFRLVEV